MRRSTALPLLALAVFLPLSFACSSESSSGHSSSAGTASSSETGSRASASSSLASSAESSSASTASVSSSSSSVLDAGLDTGSDATTTLHDADLVDASPIEAGDASDACEVYGAPGECITTTACSAMSAHTSYAGHCPGPATIECCIVTPDTANNPPTPAGYQLMQQAQVTSAMTTWAVMILNDPTDYPMFSTTTMTFGSQLVLARVEWHPPDFQNSIVHRGVTLYVPV